MIFLVSNQSLLFPRFKNISIDKSIELLNQEPELGLDTETTGLDCYTKKLLLLQIGTEEFQILFDIASFDYKIPEKLKNWINQSNSLFILQNAKFDAKFLFRQGIILRKVYDTMLVETIITNGLQYSGRDLNSLVIKYCNDSLDKSVRGDIIKFGLSEAVLIYGARDIEFLQKIKREQMKIVIRFQLKNAVDLDNSFVIALAYIEYCGIKLDYKKWSIRTDKNKEKALILKNKLNDQLWQEKKYNYFSGMMDLWNGEPECTINWASSKQVIKLFKEYGINVILKEKGEEKETVDAKILEPQKHLFPILKPYLEYKEMLQAISTFGDNWKKFINPVTGRIHTTFQQLMDTGRLSSGNKRDGTPNLQNIPSDDETRSCFICEEGTIMIDADYSSQEQVILANFSQEENLINFYAKGFKDMHSYVAFLMYPAIRECTIEELTPEKLYYIPEKHSSKRKLAKNAGFAINYGGNGATIAKNCNIPRTEGDFVYTSYFKSFPGLKNYFEFKFEETSKSGYITFNPITKRKLFYDLSTNDYFVYNMDVQDPYFWQNEMNAREINKKYNTAKSEIQRKSQNYPIQGSAADVTKLATIYFFKEILKNNWFDIVKIVNIVHDELLIECPIELKDNVDTILINCMERAGIPFCPIVSLKADSKSGDHWVH